MSRSSNEVMTLATKAARGAGAPAAQAAAFGQAAMVHLLLGRDPDVLSAALAALPEGPIIALPLAIDRIAETARGGRARGRMGSGDRAQLLSSYLAALPYVTMLDVRGTLKMDLTKASPNRKSGRIELPDELVAEWTALAARLLVPETEASRRSGAGAGLTDND